MHPPTHCDISSQMRKSHLPTHIKDNILSTEELLDISHAKKVLAAQNAFCDKIEYVVNKLAKVEIASSAKSVQQAGMRALLAV